MVDNDTESEAGELANRRPIKSRGMAIFQSAAAALARTSVTPNMVSVSSVLFSLIAGVCMAATACLEGSTVRGILWLVAALMVQARLIANLLDGMVAMEGGKATAEGELYNEVPDRISDALIFIGAGYSVIGIGVLGWAAALVAMFVAYVRAIGASVSAGQVFVGPMAKPHRMALMTLSGLALAAIEFTGSGGQISGWILNGSLVIVIGLGVVTAVRRLWIIAGTMQRNAE